MPPFGEATFSATPRLPERPQRPAGVPTPSALAAVHGSPQRPCSVSPWVWGTDGTARPYKPALRGSMRESGCPPQRRNRDATTTHHDPCRTAGDPQWTPVTRLGAGRHPSHCGGARHLARYTTLCRGHGREPRPRDVVDIQMSSSSGGSVGLLRPHTTHVELANPMSGPKMGVGFDVSGISRHHEGGELLVG
jgi:hypothetical protein